MLYFIWIVLTYVGVSFWDTVICGLLIKLSTKEPNKKGFGLKSTMLIFTIWLIIFAIILSVITINYQKTWLKCTVLIFGYASATMCLETLRKNKDRMLLLEQHFKKASNVITIIEVVFLVIYFGVFNVIMNMVSNGIIKLK